jgi:hypothetical protein
LIISKLHPLEQFISYDVYQTTIVYLDASNVIAQQVFCVLSQYALMTTGSSGGYFFSFKSTSVKVIGMCDHSILKAFPAHTWLTSLFLSFFYLFIECSGELQAPVTTLIMFILW